MVSLYNLYLHQGLVFTGLVIVLFWTLVWKGIGLWHSARHEQKYWFLAFLLLNTAGLLPIIYLIWFKPETEEQDTKQTRKDKAKKSTNSKKK